MERCLEKGTEDIIAKFADEVSLYTRSLGKQKLLIVLFLFSLKNF
jgi:hypothetical protein